MYSMYAKWVSSWRDLPVLINQWNNVVRWQKRTFLFLRTTEFLWQEGHTAHETEKQAIDFALKALDWYKTLYEDYLAMYPIIGIKSENEKLKEQLSKLNQSLSQAENRFDYEEERDTRFDSGDDC